MYMPTSITRPATMASKIQRHIISGRLTKLLLFFSSSHQSDHEVKHGDFTFKTEETCILSDLGELVT